MNTEMNLISSASSKFIMGDNNIVGTAMNQAPQHNVKFTYNYYMDVYAVNLALWKSVYRWAKSNGYTFEECVATGKGDNYPVYKVGWVDCIKWCNARSEMEGFIPVYYNNPLRLPIHIIRSGQQANIPPANCIKDGNGYRLPTEAEWEYAARGGAMHTYYPYGNKLDPKYATYLSASWVPVNSNLPGNFGLLNMAGNIKEWCYELYYKYTVATQTDPWQPGAPSDNKTHITRGGSFMSAAWRTACCARKPYSDNWARNKPSNNLQHGFRVARTMI
jgi:formylglycine-generating enzyme required for sulfatase activity